MASIVVTTACEITLPVYNKKSFAVGDVVEEISPYYFPLVNSGNASIKPTVQLVPASYGGTPTDGQALVWDAVKGYWTPKAIAGSSSASKITFTSIAGTDLSGHRIVKQSGSTALLASNADSTGKEQLHMTVGAATATNPVELHSFGSITDPSWNWTVGAPIYLGTAGQLTQTAPTGAVLLVRLGTATASDTMFYDPKPAIQLV